KHEHRQDDRLERHHHREQAERKRIEPAERRVRERTDVQDDPDEKYPDVDEEEGEAPAERADPVRDLHYGGALVLFFLVDVARRGTPEELGVRAQAPPGRGEQIEDRLWIELEELVEI